MTAVQPVVDPAAVRLGRDGRAVAQPRQPLLGPGNRVSHLGAAAALRGGPSAGARSGSGTPSSSRSSCRAIAVPVPRADLHAQDHAPFRDGTGLLRRVRVREPGWQHGRAGHGPDGVHLPPCHANNARHAAHGRYAGPCHAARRRSRRGPRAAIDRPPGGRPRSESPAGGVASWHGLGYHLDLLPVTHERQEPGREGNRIPLGRWPGLTAMPTLYRSYRQYSTARCHGAGSH